MEDSVVASDSRKTALGVEVDPLVWERGDGTDPSDVGICLSGGGIRAASFAYGVLQTLQDQKGLLFGAESARVLAAVSGGSYIAAAYMLGAKGRLCRPDDYALDPLASGSAEETHIGDHSDYLAARLWRYLLWWTINLTSLIWLFIWMGVMLPTYAVMDDLLDGTGASSIAELFQYAENLPLYVVLMAFIVAWFTLVRSYYAAGFLATACVLIGLLFVVLTVNPLVEEAASWKSWWTLRHFGWTSFILFVGMLVMTAVPIVARRIGVVGTPARWLNQIVVYSPRFAGLVLLAWAAYWGFRTIIEPMVNRDDYWAGGMFFLILFGAWFLSERAGRSFLHREYRDRIESCFGVWRVNGSAEPAGDPYLSHLQPPPDAAYKFPRLLVSATANVHTNIPGAGRTTFAPFVFSHDVCGVPGDGETAWKTIQLELGQVPTSLLGRKKEPLVTLFSSVACTGAAVSPSMGRWTLPTARLIIAALNIRLGGWLPNPYDPRARTAVNERKNVGEFKYRSRTMGRGYDELIPEIVGLSGPRVYVSDGGHYDNLGLLAVLRAKCKEVWCVDSSPDRKGEAEELVRIIEVAKLELGIMIDIDLTSFTATPNGLYPATHAEGTIRYRDGTLGRLIVVKLGLSEESRVDLRNRRFWDRALLPMGGRFPHHDTTWVQIFSPDRAKAYRCLGRDSARRCLESLS